MARFFFDTHDGRFHRDDVGLECVDIDAACAEAMASLPEIAHRAIPEIGSSQTHMVIVRDETGAAVYTAMLTIAGVRMDDASVGDRQSVATPSSIGSHPLKP